MIQPICWVLIHSLWQGMLLAVAGGLVIACTKRSAPALRYRWLCALSAIFLAGIGATLYYEAAMVSGGPGDGGGIGVPINVMGDWCSANAFPIVVTWVVVAAVKSIWMATGWTYMRRIRREGRSARALWVHRMDELARQLGVRRTVKLVESALVRVPMVVGQLRPIIFVPLGLINHLPAGEMEAVLMHELAHVRRYDHVVNLVQQVAECILFFNPGFLWISALVRDERENCCDDMAIAHTRDRVEFVRALVRFKEYSLHGAVLAFPGSKRQLLHRVLRISRLENKTLSGRERLVLVGGSLALLCLLGMRATKDNLSKMEMPGKSIQSVEVRQTGERPAAKASAELISVLQKRENVAQNLEWVQSQLERLHRKTPVNKRPEKLRNITRANSNFTPPNPGQGYGELAQAGAELKRVDGQIAADPDKDQGGQTRLKAEQDREQMERNREQAERNREQADRNRQQAELDRQQAERNRHQADLDRQQAARNREQAERNREQADLNRQQAERSRDQADASRKQADMGRMQAESDRLQAEKDRQQAESDKQQADRDRQQAERDRQQDQQQAARDREQADRDRQQADKERKQAQREREQAGRVRQQKEQTREQK